VTVYSGSDLYCNNDLVAKHRRWKWWILFLLGLIALLLFLLQQAGIGTSFAAPEIVSPALGTEISAGELTLAGTGQPNSSVEVLCNDDVLGNTDVDAEGKWAFSTTVDNSGTCEYQAKSIDEAGNIRATSNVMKYGVSALALGGMAAGSAEIIKPMLELPTVSLVPGQIDIAGSAMPNTELEFLIDGEVEGLTSVDDAGRWSYSATLPNAQEYSLAARTIYDNGEVAIPSDDYRVVVGNVGAMDDAMVPMLDLPSGALAPGAIALTGAGLANSNLGIMIDGALDGKAAVDGSGQWSHATELTEPGEYLVQLNALDDNDEVVATSDEYTVVVDAAVLGSTEGNVQNSGGDDQNNDQNVVSASVAPTRYFVRATSTATGTPQGGVPTQAPRATATSVPPTSTALPSATDTPEATSTSVPPTATNVSPTDTLEPTATDTPVPPTAVPPTAVPPTDTPAPTATATDTPEPETSTVGGTVWLDIDNNGLKDSDEPANILSMPVTITDEDGNTQTANTTLLGTFEFADVAPNRNYVITFIKPAGFNFTLNDVGDDDTIDSDVQVPNPQGAPNDGMVSVNVGEGEAILLNAGLTPDVGINMELVLSDSLVCAGQDVTVQMYTRLLNASEGFQLRNIEIYNTDLGSDVDIRATYFVPESDLNDNGYLDWLDLDGEDYVAPNGDLRSDEEFLHQYTRAFYESTLIQAGDKAEIFYSNTPNDPSTGTSLGQSVAADDSAQVTVVNPKLSITVSPAAGSVAVGEEALFNVAVLNAGDIDITDLEVSHGTITRCDQVVPLLAPGEILQYVCNSPALATNQTLQVRAQGTAGNNLCAVSDEGSATVTALLPPTAVPPTAVPPTAVPPTATYTVVPPTTIPPTATYTVVSPTSVPPTAVPPTATYTAIPPTAISPTAIPTIVPSTPTPEPPKVLPTTGVSLQRMWAPNIMIPLFGILLLGLVGLFESRRKRNT